LLARLGGLGIIIPSVSFLLSSSSVATPLVYHLLMKSISFSLDVYQQMYKCKLDLWVSRHSNLSAQAGLLCDQLCSHLHDTFEAVSE